jgi:NAD+ synthase (glutamine-hydrolysing)
MAISRSGNLLLRADSFKEDMLVFDFNKRYSKKKIKEDRVSNAYSALKLGLKDYVHKNNFNKVVFGVSGGVDFAVTAAIAKDALGRSNVLGLIMPSRYTSSETFEDAVKLCCNLRIEYKVIPIEDIFSSYLQRLEHFFGKGPSVAQENIQARIRGNILMAFSNKFGHLLLNTGNKSEIATGYCTLYGDMNGGFSVIKDVPKMLVFELSRYCNTSTS